MSRSYKKPVVKQNNNQLYKKWFNKKLRRNKTIFQEPKMELRDILTLFDKYGISNLKDLERTLYFTCYYKTENSKLKDEIRKLKNPTPKYVVVKNPKTRRKTIMEKVRRVLETYRACSGTTYFGYFQELEHLGEFATLEEAELALRTLKEK